MRPEGESLNSHPSSSASTRQIGDKREFEDGDPLSGCQCRVALEFFNLRRQTEQAGEAPSRCTTPRAWAAIRSSSRATATAPAPTEVIVLVATVSETK